MKNPFMPAQHTRRAIEASSTPRRLFFALTLPPALRHQMVDWRAGQFPAETGRPVAQDNLHLTLAFLGNVGAAQERSLVAAAGRLRQSPFTLRLDDCGHWPRTGVVWLGCHQSSLPFHPHITLWRQALKPVALPPDTLGWTGHSTAMVHIKEGLMLFEPALKPARLIQRYKRFLAYVVTPDGEALTLHCPNTGAMTGCATPGDTVWYSTSDNRKRRYPHSWELTETASGQWIGVNTLRANTLVGEALRAGTIPALAGYTHLRSEVRYGAENSRIDWLLSAEGRADCYIEVKSVTLLQHQSGYFPDAVTLRGQKHLRELQAMAEMGYRAVLFFAVLHSGIDRVSPARHIDPHYADLVLQAKRYGVEVLCYGCQLSRYGIRIHTPLPIIIS